MCLPLNFQVNYGCDCLTLNPINKNLSKEKEAFDKKECGACCAYGLASRTVLLGHAICCIPHNLICSLGAVVGSVIGIGSSIIGGSATLLCGCVTGCCCCGNEEACNHFKAAIIINSACVACAGVSCAAAGVALGSSCCEVICLPVNLCCPEAAWLVKIKE